jgi:hypothetical protein
MEQRSLWSEAFAQWEEDRQWKRPPSWWNLLILLPLLAMLLWSVHNSRTDFEIAKRQRATVATINSHDPPNHDRYGYIFLVKEIRYTGWAYPSDKINYSLGERVVIQYDPIDPTKNLPESFEEAGGRDLIFAPFCLADCCGAAVIYFLSPTRIEQGSSQISRGLYLVHNHTMVCLRSRS